MMKNGIHCPSTIELEQQSSLLVVPDKRSSLLVVYFQTHLDRITAIITALYERFSASITNPLHLWHRKVYMECRLALRTTSSSAQSPDDILARNLKIHDPVQGDTFRSQHRS